MLTGPDLCIIKTDVAVIIIIVIIDKAPRPSISNVIWVLSSDTICQLNQLFSNSEVAMLSMTEVLWEMLNRLSSRIKVNCLNRKISLNFTMYIALVHAT